MEKQAYNLGFDDCLPLSEVPEYPAFKLKRSRGKETSYRCILDDQGRYLRTESFLAPEGDLLRDIDLKYIPDVTENLFYRLKKKQELESYPELKEKELLYCKSSILYYVNTYTWTYNPKLEGMKVIPFVTYKNQDKLLLFWVYAIKNHEDTVCVKSREEGASWLASVKDTWLGVCHKNMTTYQLSMTENEVDNKEIDSLMEKSRFVLRKSPDFLKGGWVEDDRDDIKMKIKFKKSQSILQGKLTGGNAGRSGRSTTALYDEFAFIKNAAEVQKAASGLSGNSNFFSTVNGSSGDGGSFYRMVMAGQNVFKMHWSENPMKNKEWALKERSKAKYADPANWAQEQDMDFNASTKGKIFPEFKEYGKEFSQAEWIHAQDSNFVEKSSVLPVTISIYLGRGEASSMLFSQMKPSPKEHIKSSEETLVIFEEYNHASFDIEFFVSVLKEKKKEGYLFDKIILCNPYFLNTYYLKDLGIPIRKKSFHLQHIEAIQRSLKKEGFFAVNRKCKHTIVSFMNWAYPYNEKNNQVDPNSKPIMNEFSQVIIAASGLLQEKKEKKVKRTLPVWDFKEHKHATI